MTSSTPPPRRRPVPSQPTRRPRVAGLRKPEAPPRRTPEPDGTDPGNSTEQTQIIPKTTVENAAEQTIEQPAITGEPDSPAASAPAAQSPAAQSPAPPARPAPRQKAKPLAQPRPDGEDEPEQLSPTPRRRRRTQPGDESAASTPGTIEDPVPADADADADSRPDDDVIEPAEMAVDQPADARRRWLVPSVLALVAVLLGGAAVWFGLQWSHNRSGASGGDSGNTALTDSATTSEVSGQITAAVNQTFSFDYTNLGKTQKAVQQVLTGKALCEYNLLFQQVQQQAPSQKLVLTTTVQDKGVELLQGNTARVLLLVEQHDTRATTNQTSDSQSMIAVNAIKQNGVWKISAIDTFSGSNNPVKGC